MSKKPNNSNRRDSDRLKARCAHTSDQLDGRMIETPSAPVRKTSYEHLVNRAAYEMLDQSGYECVAAVPAVPIRSRGPVPAIQSLSNDFPQLGFYVEEVNSFESPFSPDRQNSPLTDMWNESFGPNVLKTTIQPLMTSTSPPLNDNDSVWSIVQPESPMTPDSEEGLMVAETATERVLSTSNPASSLHSSNFFSHSDGNSIDAAFIFNPQLNVDLAKYSIGNWDLQDQPVANADFSTVNDSYTHHIRLNSTESGPEPGPGILSSCFYDAPHGLRPLTREVEVKPERTTIQPMSSPSPPADSPAKGDRKRRVSTDDKNNEDGDDNKVKCGRWTRMAAGERPLACPFHKKDSQRYQACGKYTLRRIKDVKQHLHRLHCKPEIYCSICFENFKCPGERDRHTREARCTKKAVPDSDGTISEDQKKKLKDCGSRGMSKQDQWMKLWEVIFPGVKQPRSPHVENDQAELLSCIRDSWDSNAGGFFTSFLLAHGSESFSPIQIRQVIDNFLDYIETTMTYPNGNADAQRATVLQQPMAPEDSIEEIPLLHLEIDLQSEAERTRPTTPHSPDTSSRCQNYK